MPFTDRANARARLPAVVPSACAGPYTNGVRTCIALQDHSAAGERALLVVPVALVAQDAVGSICCTGGNNQGRAAPATVPQQGPVPALEAALGGACLTLRPRSSLPAPCISWPWRSGVQSRLRSCLST